MKHQSVSQVKSRKKERRLLLFSSSATRLHGQSCVGEGCSVSHVMFSKEKLNRGKNKRSNLLISIEHVEKWKRLINLEIPVLV